MHIRWLGLLVMLWFLPLRTAYADLNSFVNALVGPRPCQPATLATLAHFGGGFVLPVGRRLSMPLSETLQHSIELGTGLQCALRGGDSPGLLFTPELGYSLTILSVNAAPAVLTHLVKVGVGIGYGNEFATVSYVPRLVVGVRDQDRALGLRQA